MLLTPKIMRSKCQGVRSWWREAAGQLCLGSAVGQRGSEVEGAVTEVTGIEGAPIHSPTRADFQARMLSVMLLCRLSSLLKLPLPSKQSTFCICGGGGALSDGRVEPGKCCSLYPPPSGLSTLLLTSTPAQSWWFAVKVLLRGWAQRMAETPIGQWEGASWERAHLSGHIMRLPKVRGQSRAESYAAAQGVLWLLVPTQQLLTMFVLAAERPQNVKKVTQDSGLGGNISPSH